MAQMRLLLDADILSFLLKKDKYIANKYWDLLYNHNTDFFISPMVYYQVKRGLIDKKASRKLFELNKLINTMSWIEFDRDDWERAITLYLYLKKAGFSPEHQDGDILIAAQAEGRKAKVITNNLKDFRRLGVECETWKV